ncbi:hypothetical protein [Endozoicomonas sp. SCSIO W0465]|uniref:hypothetical protein n=1 Tax=Endozoicomonas sp. SCSIO W0465 TaxID=2918516 RepID=UPI00207609FA|nr:hypothetical protein [Endozoicomonas sp. SCSIO W0465]USE35505.1 hypothetical protein MJO57_25995 [Endozoicomonas sp. SCSIO W0465]
MHALPELSSALSHVHKVGVKKDAASQTEYCCQAPTTNGRTVSYAQPSLSVPDNGTTAEKSLSDYGVQFAREVLQAGLQGSNKLMRNVAGFAYRQAMESEQLSLVCPGIKESLALLAAMPSLAGAYPVSTRPACPDGAFGCSMTYTNNNGSKAATSYTLSSAYPTTNLTTTAEPTAFYNTSGFFVLLSVCGLIGVPICSMIGYSYCSDVYNSYKLLKRENPEASNCQAIRAAFNHRDYYGQSLSLFRSPDDRIRLPVRPAPSAPVPTAPTTCEQATQTTCEQGTQTEHMVNETALHGQQPPTYAEATAQARAGEC